MYRSVSNIYYIEKSGKLQSLFQEISEKEPFPGGFFAKIGRLQKSVTYISENPENVTGFITGAVYPYSITGERGNL